MRPPAIERMGFYPTSNQVAELLVTWFKPADTGRLLDPCCSEGLAAKTLAKALNCTSLGVELSVPRNLHKSSYQTCYSVPASTSAA